MKLLLVDDDPSFLMIAAHLLRADGRFDVREAAGGNAALEAVRNERPDAVLSDFRMEGMDGLELMARLRALDGFSDLPIVFCTGKTGAAFRDRAMAAGARGFLGKPFDTAAFAGQLHALLSPPGSAP